MIGHILRKDWTLLWPLVALVTAIQIGFEWAAFKAGFFSENHVARELVGLLSVAWTVGILAIAVAVVHEDSIPGAEQDWLIRPISRSDLLLSKGLFVLLTVCVPMLLVNLVHTLVLGFPALPGLAIALYKELFVFVCLLLPVMALAAATRNMTELLVFGTSLVVVYAAALGIGGVLLGASACPTCESAIVWTQHLLQHLGVLAGAIAILVLQFFRRRTTLSRAVAVAGVIMLVFLQLPWRLAFTVQSWLGMPRAATSVSVTLDRAEAEAGLADPTAEGSRDSGSGFARRTTQALLEGNVGAAVESLKRVRPVDAPVPLRIPLRLTGVAGDEFLFVDRTRLSAGDGHGRVLYRGGGPRGSVALRSDPTSTPQDPGLVVQTVEIPQELYRKAQREPVELSVDYSLTLMAVTAQHRISAEDGELRAPETGLCRSKAQSNEILIVCKQLGRAPVCYGATLYGPDGRHNPEVLQCTPDYRPYLPALGNILTVSAVELPTHDASGLAHYAVGVSGLSESYVELKIYAPRAHFTRVLQPFPLRASAGVSADPTR
ncbi:MAG TPA: hypothetical protein VGL55_08430 [Steroidobacteraceae bacterium]|jgi:ABC-type transport system involved in multi-copper enzyme maturation permease subunit